MSSSQARLTWPTGFLLAFLQTISRTTSEAIVSAIFPRAGVPARQRFGEMRHLLQGCPGRHRRLVRIDHGLDQSGPGRAQRLAQHVGALARIIDSEAPDAKAARNRGEVAVRHLQREPRPVAPVVQPEAVADAVYKIVLAPRRETWIGWSTAMTIVGSTLAPRLLDRYLARVAVDGQQTRLPVSPGRRDNLVEPIYELHRTRGSFGRESERRAMTVSGTAGRPVPVVIGALAFFALGALAARNRLLQEK
jgi:hypothetical protein